MKLHDRLKEIRKEREFTLLQVKERTGLSVSYLSDLERGRTSNPTLDTLEKLALCYGLTLPDLVTGVEGWGESTSASLPPGLKVLVESGMINEGWAQDLSRLEFRGKRPQTEDEWRDIYYYMRRMMKPYLDE
jgi:transcriptional regulator with XRE-family HTH domain